MAFTFNSDPGDPLANSWASVEEADEHFGGRIGAARWFALSLLEKQQTLATGTAVLEGWRYLGEQTFVDQRLQWPRSGVVYLGADVDPDVVPNALKYLLFEYALYRVNLGLAKDPLQPSALDRFSSISVPGPVTLTMRDKSNDTALATLLPGLPEHIARLLVPWLLIEYPARPITYLVRT